MSGREILPRLFTGSKSLAYHPKKNTLPIGVRSVAMVVLGGVVGVIAGFLLGLLITEVIVGNSASSSGFDWQFWTDVLLLAVVGAIAGCALGRRLRRSNVGVS